ncbi:MAG: hypothetical protein JNM75_00780 [Rhodospirillales bacterium]|nr:hypothetical protein [Rhodospirillales bacterium]
MDQPVPSQSSAAPSLRDLEVRIERIAVLIAGARRLIEEGQAVDLTVLGFATVDLRDAVLRASAEATLGLAPRVIALQAAMDALGEDLAAASGPVVREIAAAARRSAFRAYDGKGDGKRPDRRTPASERDRDPRPGPAGGSA